MKRIIGLALALTTTMALGANTPLPRRRARSSR